MSMVETVYVREERDVAQRVAELQLGSRDRLLKIVAAAVAASADATQFHPANAPGTFAYHHGTAALREEYVGDTWSLDRPSGVEAIRNEAIKVKIAFANVDLACNDEQKPRPRSRKGAGAERVCIGNLFGELPEYAPRPDADWAIYYLMVDGSGAAELTRPVLRDGTFKAFIERIYISDESDLDREPIGLEDGDIADDFDPQVVRV